MGKLLDVFYISKFLKLSKQKLWELVRYKQIPHIRLGRRVYFEKQSILDWLKRIAVDKK